MVLVPLTYVLGDRFLIGDVKLQVLHRPFLWVPYSLFRQLYNIDADALLEILQASYFQGVRGGV